ncbi:unnamed protein product [Sympodiomycopsis kandeliae]
MPRTTRAARAATAEAEAAAARAVETEDNQDQDVQDDANKNGQQEGEPSTSKAGKSQFKAASQQGRSQRQSQAQASGGNSEESADEIETQKEASTSRQQGGPSQSSSSNPNAYPRPVTSFKPKDPDNYIKIMLATDNHIGYMERDPVRGQDSINTFREILQLAVDNDVDMILLGGDLFHENKPSRATLHQVIASIREKCLGDKPVSLELLSDPNDGRAEGYSFPAVNYEDSNLNVGIPIFSIHGNHDDPQGVGVDGALSALDILSVSGLVNYFGKVDLPTDDQTAGKSSKRAPNAGGLSDVGIRIRPVLLQKGSTKLALYGMGNIKDERMHYELRSNRVRMYRPREDPDEWFNILCVHQNRAAYNPKACVPETMFDDSIHLVVWGHEHEQRIAPDPVGGKKYRISQPGSSVATSLSPGEAAEKQVAIIHIENQDYFMEPIVLQSVRPFHMDDMALDEEAADAGIDLDDKMAVQNLLKSRVYELIDRATEDWESKHADLPEDERPEAMLPLIRLRVEYSAQHAMGNPIRFGQEFVDKVANPRELLSFSKRRGATAKKSASNTDPRFNYVEVDPEEGMSAERFEKIKVGGLVQQFLQKQKLEILNAEGLDRAISNYVDKDDKSAIEQFIDSNMKKYQKDLNHTVTDENSLNDELSRLREGNSRLRDARADNEEDEEGEADGATGSSSKRSGGASRARQAAQRRNHDSDDSMLSDGDADLFGDNDNGSDGESSRRSASPVKSGRGSGRGRGRGRGGAAKSARGGSSSTGRGKSQKTFLGDDDDEDDDRQIEDEDDIMSMDDDDDDGSKGRKASSTSTATTKSRADILSRNKKPAARKPAASGSRSIAKPTTGARSTGGRAAGRKAAQKVAANANDSDDNDSGDDSPGFEIDEEASQPARGGSKKGSKR